MVLNQQQQSTLDELRGMASKLVAGCPDMRQMARETAQTILAKYGHSELDPDHVYLNRFERANTCPRTFSGWEHYQSPYQSYTLPQLVMHRFDAQDQDNADLLSYLTGFYRDGADKTAFDERNEIALAPAKVLADFWAIDFCSRFNQQLETFWSQQADDFRTLAKAVFLSKVIDTCEENPHSELAKRSRRVAQALTGTLDWPPTLAQLRQQVTPASGYRLRTFDIGGQLASDILRVEMDDGSQLLYTPGDVQALHLFPTYEDLYFWVLENNNHADNRSRFMGHFPLSSHAERDSSVGLNHLIDLLYYNWGGKDHQHLNQLDAPIQGDAFDHLRDNACRRMREDAHFALRSNADLRKQLWIGYLKAFGEVFSGMAALGWPVALAVVGAGLAETGLQVDQAINGHTTAEREAGTVGAVLAAINTLFNAAFLIGAPGEAVDESPRLGEHVGPDRTTEPATSAEIDAWAPAALQPASRTDLLRPFRTNVLLGGEPGTGDLEGIYSQDGNFYALIDNLPYQVRRVAQMHTWVVVDPNNPYSFYRNVPLRLLAGEWHPYENPGLRGGMLPRKWLGLWGRQSATRALTELPATSYEVPEALRTRLKAAALSGDTRGLSGTYASLDPDVENGFAEFRDLRDRLSADAESFMSTFEQPARPVIPELSRQASPKEIIRGIFERSNGLVIGEGHSELGSKRFLIENMAQLRKAQVKVLYLEHYMTDFNQADLDLFNHSGNMTPELEHYVNQQDIGHFTDRSGRYTFKQVLMAAQKEKIQIQSIDCMASYRQAWEDGAPALARQRMMNFYAHTIIEADQQARGACRWVALVGNSHSNTFEGVPGISELQGAIGLRIEDIHIDKIGGVGLDPGVSITRPDLSVATLRADLRLQVPIRIESSSGRLLESVLHNQGSFSFLTSDGQLNLVHRSKNGNLTYTPIQRNGRYLQIDKPDWPWISGRHLHDLLEIRGILERWGLHYRQV